MMRACMDELKRSRHVDTSELTVEAGLFKSLSRVLRRQLDPCVRGSDAKTETDRMRLADAEELATYLLRYDAVTFLRYLETLRVAEGRESVWLYTDAAHHLRTGETASSCGKTTGRRARRGVSAVGPR